MTNYYPFSWVILSRIRVNYRECVKCLFCDHFLTKSLVITDHLSIARLTWPVNGIGEPKNNSSFAILLRDRRTFDEMVIDSIAISFQFNVFSVTVIRVRNTGSQLFIARAVRVSIERVKWMDDFPYFDLYRVLWGHRQNGLVIIMGWSFLRKLSPRNSILINRRIARNNRFGRSPMCTISFFDDRSRHHSFFTSMH